MNPASPLKRPHLDWRESHNFFCKRSKGLESPLLSSPTRIFQLHCQFQIRSWGIKNLRGKHLSGVVSPHSLPAKEEGAEVCRIRMESLTLERLPPEEKPGDQLSEIDIQMIANISYAILFSGQLDVSGSAWIASSTEDFLQSVRRISSTRCLFMTNQMLGEGRTKTVYEGIQVQINKKKELSSVKISSVALICISGSPVEISMAIHEDERAEILKSPYALKKSFCRFYETPSSIVFVNKKLSPSLHALNKQDVPLSWGQSIIGFGDIAECLAEIHEKNFLHRDVKLENMAFQEKACSPIRRGVLLDYGFMIHLKNLGESHLRLSPLYAAPELAAEDYLCYLEEMDCFQRKQTMETDLWAFGIALYEFFSPERRVPYFLRGLKTIPQLCGRLLKLHFDLEYDTNLFKVWNENPEWNRKGIREIAIQKIIRKLLSLNPYKRGTSRELSVELRKILDLPPIDLKTRRWSEIDLYGREPQKINFLSSPCGYTGTKFQMLQKKRQQDSSQNQKKAHINYA